MRKKKQGTKFGVPGRRDNFPTLPSLLRDQTQPGLFSREKEEAGNKVWSPWASGQLPHTFPFCCVTRLNKGFSLVRKKKKGTKFGVPGVGRTSPPFPSLLRDQTHTRVILSRERRSRNKVWSPWASGQLPHASPPCCMTRLNQGYSLVRRKKQGTKFGVAGRRENFPIPHLPAA